MAERELTDSEPVVTVETQRQIDALCDEFEQAFRDGEKPRIEDYPRRLPDTCRPRVLRELVAIEVQLLAEVGSPTNVDDYRRRFPDAAIVLEKGGLTTKSQLAEAVQEDSRPDSSQPPPAREHLESPIPPKIGRYELGGLLGQGGFGSVYVAHDRELDRHVAIKVQRPSSYTPDELEAFRKEARILADLDHAHIVPVFDTGQLDDGRRYIVSKWIDGTNLAEKLAQQRMPFDESARLLAVVADALHYAHRKKLVHRDVKPANILVDSEGNPFVADFGLVLTDQEFGDEDMPQGGTAAYMSPEQARIEGHRIDGRSDIFSLGVVMYEMLTGERPFMGETVNQVLDHIKMAEARPPRMLDDTIPRELERICLKALSKLATDRYNTAMDMAEDLRHFELGEQPDNDTLTATRSTYRTDDDKKQVAAPIRIVPKGLRSFDKNDADFFLELLPGPRDREGLPDSIRFWKTRIEETEIDAAFGVGLIYGPSGCGKSSLVKAGLIPRLANHVVSVYLEATPADTESQLRRRLLKRCPGLLAESSLIDALIAIRHGRAVPAGSKVCIILDQFEQWLHANDGEGFTDLVQALRQCDGDRLQCILMVRDDFWMPITRFMRKLDMRLSEGDNSKAVDLFPIRHASQVLEEFGRAYGILPDDALTVEQQEFIATSVKDLAEEGKVTCVRLAIFAEMMKDKPWTIASFKSVGGTEGIGVSFLDETFTSSTAPPEHRVHQKAARAILKILLPESGSEIKGNMRSREELIDAAEYKKRPSDFEDVVRILDNELRLITPTGQLGPENGANDIGAVKTYYQLTHDYLVPALRDWLHRAQKKTVQGRAELRLAERSAAWKAKQETRDLPAWWEAISIWCFTRQNDWTEPQSTMMRMARRRLIVCASLSMLLLTSLLLVGATVRHRMASAESRNIVFRLLEADMSRVPKIVAELAPYRRWAEPELQSICDNSNESDHRKVRANIALIPWGISHLGNLKESMLTTSPGEEFSAMIGILEQSAQQHGERQWLVNNLWFDLEKSPHVFQLASALAHYDPTHARWQKVSPKIVDALFDGEADNSLLWRPHLSHVWHHLEGSFVRRLLNEQDRSIRQAILLGLGESQPQRLSELCGESIISKIEDWYLHDTDPGIHGAARWILRQWGLDARITELDARLRSELPARPAAKDKNGWYVNEFGQTMIVISAPGRFKMGSPNSEQNRTPDETLHTEEITRSFAIASNEVTKDQYLQFFPDFDIHEKHLFPESDCPIGGVTLGEAAAYCNQLSRQEGIPEDQLCYVVTAPNKVRLVPDYVARAGYRLPTEAEWEYTCRAGTRTSWYHGPSLELLTDYGWFRHNSSNRTWPIASLKPNGFGIFDMHGNVYEWCHAHNGTLLRGGSFNSSAQHLRSANRLQYHPALRESLVPGFRVARTLNGWNP